MTAKKKTPFIVYLGYMTVITVAIWIVFDVYRALTVKPAPPVSPSILNPLSPNLDLNALDRLQNKIYLEDTEIGDTVITIETTPEEEVINEELIATEEAVVATDEGNLEGI